MAAAEVNVFDIQDINVLRKLYEQKAQQADAEVAENQGLKRALEEAKAEAAAQMKQLKKASHSEPIGWQQTGKLVVEMWKAKQALVRELRENVDLLPEHRDNLQQQGVRIARQIQKFTNSYPEFAEYIKASKDEIKMKDERKQTVARLPQADFELFESLKKEKERKEYLSAWRIRNTNWQDLPLRPKIKKEKKPKEPKQKKQKTSHPEPEAEPETETTMDISAQIAAAAEQAAMAEDAVPSL